MLCYNSIFLKRVDSADDISEKAVFQNLREAHRKLSKELPRGVRDTSWRRQDPSASYVVENVTKVPKVECLISRKTTFFENKVFRAAFRKFINYGGRPTVQVCISTLLQLDAVMKNPIDCLAEFVTSSKKANKNAAQRADLQSSDVLLSRTSRDWAVPQEIVRKLKLMLPIAHPNLLTFCSRGFREVGSDASEIPLSEVATKCVRSTEERMNSSHREHTVCFKMPDFGHYDVHKTAHASNDFICDWIGNVFDCSILHSEHLKGLFTLFHSTDRQAVLYESSENQNISAVN